MTMKALYLYKYYILFLVSVVIISCQPADQKKVKKERKQVMDATVVPKPEDQAVNLIMNLEEVKRKSEQVERDSKGKRHLSTYVETPPTDADLNYWIKVAEDNGGSYVTYYTFAVNSKNREISYYDAINDSLISLSQWRRTTPLEER
jgi:hypothetical protein